MFTALTYACLSFLCGAILHLAMAPYNFAFLLFICLPILYYILQRAERKRIKFLYTWLFSFGYFIFGLSWISNALLVPGNEDFYWAYPLALGGLPAVLALFPAFFVTFITSRFDLEHISGWWAFVVALSLSELARGFLFTGFPWNNFAYTWISVLPIAQMASIGGLYFLTILTIFWASVPALILMHKRNNAVIITLLGVIITASMSYYWGYQRIKTEPIYGTNEIMLHLVQPNIVQDQKWASGKMEQHFDTLTTLSQKSLNDNNANINVIIWPETASVRSILFRPENKAALQGLLPSTANNYLVTGLLHASKNNDGGRDYFNSVTVFGTDLKIIGNYDKSHLVPFGEYIPFQKFIPITPVANFSGFQTGPGPQTIPITNTLSISPLICYEVIFPGRSIDNSIKQKPKLIINVTNDAWYGDSSGPRQHLVQAQFRAIETGIPLARVANTGISALISPLGTPMLTISYGQKTAKSHPLILPLQNETYFARFNHKIMMVLLSLICLALYLYKKNS